MALHSCIFYDVVVSQCRELSTFIEFNNIIYFVLIVLYHCSVVMTAF